jgi:hypothetical protein
LTMMTPSTSLERLSERLGIDREGRHLGLTTIRRLLTYYLLALGLTALFAWWFSTGFASPPAAPPGDLQSSAPEVPLHPLRLLARGALAILGSFILSVPLAFTYVRTRSRVNYDRNVVQTVIMLPVVVAAILVVVENSLALAFSLAGIVAAVRFRNNLQDSRDAVYIFAAIGVGFASGVRQLPVAALLSVSFVVLELVLWRFDLTADHERALDVVCGPRGAPAAATLPATASPTNEHDVEGKPDAGTDRKRLLRVYLADDSGGRSQVERVLEQATLKWKLLERRLGGVAQRVFDYEIRLRPDDTPDHVIERLHADGGRHLLAAEVVAQ